jgi:hypothetical protein
MTLMTQAIVQAILDTKLSYLLDRIVGIIFLGTPNRGSDFATYAKYVAIVGKHLGFGSHSNILQDLEQDSRSLFDLRNNFVRWLNKSTVRINCVFESRPTQIKGFSGMVRLSVHQKLEVKELTTLKYR